MKTNKIFAAALAALAMVGFYACEPKNPAEELVLSTDALSLKVGESQDLVANVAVTTWTSSDETKATVTPANDGKSAKVTGVAEGNAIISATANGVTKTCVVAVKSDGGSQGGGALKGSQIWPIILDGTTLDANQSKVVASFQPNDVDQFLYVWEGTYSGIDATGKNFHGNQDGYLAMSVGGSGWSGCGFCLTADGNGWQGAEALRAAIVESPDDYFLHLAIKSTDNYSHCFYFLGVENGTKFVLGDHAVYDGPVYKDFARDGSWAEFDIPMASYASALAAAKVEAGVNVFVILTEGVQGAVLNLDAVYFYKK